MKYNQKALSVVFSLLCLNSICCDEHPLINQAKKHLKTWHAVNEKILALPADDTAVAFLEVLAIALNVDFTGYTADSFIRALKEKGSRDNICVAGYLAHRFGWQKMRESICQHTPSIFFVSRKALSDDMGAYVDKHFETLQNINKTMQNLSDCKEFMTTFLALLACEKKKQQYKVNDLDLLQEFQKVFTDETEVGAHKKLAHAFGWKGVLDIMDKKEALVTDEYLIRWYLNQGKVSIDQKPLYFSSIALKKLITYAKVCAQRACKDSAAGYQLAAAPIRDTLDLSNQYLNSLEGVEAISGIAAWQEINFNNNAIRKVPCMDAFVNLRRLSLSNNKLMVFPVLLKSLQKLEHLELCDNQIKEIPTQVQDGFEHLETLDLYGNVITELPEQLHFKRLLTLDVGRNQIKKIPSDVGSRLRYLKVQDTPLAQDMFGVRAMEVAINKIREDGNTFHVIG